VNQLLRSFILTLFVVGSLASCGDNNHQPLTIKLFEAAPGAIESGQSSKLIFVVEPSDAELTIAGIGDVSNKVEAPISPTTTTTYELTAESDGETKTATATVTVTVGAAPGTGIRVESANPVPTAGQPFMVTLTAFGADGTVLPGYRGTVHLTSSDGQAVLPADIAFDAADAGVKQIMITLKTAGLETLNANDTAVATITGSASWRVNADVPTTCIATQAPATATAGSAVGMTVIASDAYGNPATTYTGTMVVLSSDPRASLPPPVTYTAADAGSHVFTAALLSTGVQTLSATDVTNNTLTCSATIAVTPAAAKLVVTLPGSANAGYAATVGIVVKDIYDNAFPAYAGTVTFSNTDAGTGATTPAPITFTGAEGGVASTSATFVTIGSQTLAATDGTATGSAQVAVHGLVYTAPSTGRVRLVVNAANSNTQTVQLDLVANELLEVSTFFGGGPGSFAAGMNLPLDTTRVGPDATLFTPGAALPPGTGTRAAGAAIGATDHVLYTVVSRKRIAGTNFNQETQVAAGAVFYSVRLKLTPNGSVGSVFDGAQPGPLFRAAVRDQYGDDFVGQSEFGIGKLEIR